MESFLKEAFSLGKILNHLAGTTAEQNKNSKAYSFGEFAIHLVPPNTNHPLVYVAGKSSNGFFIASKIVHPDEQDDHCDFDDNQNCEETLSKGKQKQIVQDLEKIEIERVPVGIPISQNVVQLLESSSLHTQSVGLKMDSYVSHEILHPLNIQRARYLLSLYIHALKTDISNFDWPPLWVLCDGASPQNMIYMAAVPDAKLGSVRNVVVNCKGPVTEKENLPNLKTFLSQHRRPKHQQVPVETHGYALYEVFGPSSMISGNLQEEQSCIFIEFAWDGVDSMLQRPPHSCDSVLHIKTVPGSMKLATQNLFLELQQLVYLNGIQENPKITWQRQEDNPPTLPVAHNVDKFLEELNSGNLHATGNANNDDEDDIALTTPISRFTFREFRKDFDFTEELWLFLKDATSENDYITALKTIVSAVLNGSCQAVVHSANQTALAKIIREIMCSESVQQRFKIKQTFEDMLQEESTLKFLVEIGIEKIRRDYANYFMQEELVTLNQLSYYLESSSVLSDMVSRVQKLYCILEMVITLKLVLNMGHENLRALVEAALAYYKTHDANTHPVFSMSLPAFGSSSVAAMKHTCTNSLPSVWCVAMTTAASKSPLQTSVVQLSATHPVTGGECAIIDSSVLMNEVMGNRETFSFYLTHAEQSVIKLVKAKTT